MLGHGKHFILQGVRADAYSSVGFFQKRGYSAKWASVNMELGLAEFSLDKLDITNAPDEMGFRFAVDAYRDSLLEVVNDAQSAWLRIYERCVDQVFIAVRSGRVVGFELLVPEGSQFAKHGQKVGSVGCVGVVNAE